MLLAISGSNTHFKSKFHIKNYYYFIAWSAQSVKLAGLLLSCIM